MSGIDVPIVRKTNYQFNMPVSGTQDTVLEALVDTLGWVSGALIVRQYDHAFGTATAAQVAIKAINAMVGPEDPQNILVPATATTPVATVTIVNGDANNLLYVAALTAPISRYLRIVMSISQGSATGTGNFTIGVNIVGRSA